LSHTAVWDRHAVWDAVWVLFEVGFIYV